MEAHAKMKISRSAFFSAPYCTCNLSPLHVEWFETVILRGAWWRRLFSPVFSYIISKRLKFWPDRALASYVLVLRRFTSEANPRSRTPSATCIEI